MPSLKSIKISYSSPPSTDSPSPPPCDEPLAPPPPSPHASCSPCQHKNRHPPPPSGGAAPPPKPAAAAAPPPQPAATAAPPPQPAVAAPPPPAKDGPYPSPTPKADVPSIMVPNAATPWIYPVPAAVAPSPYFAPPPIALDGGGGGPRAVVVATSLSGLFLLSFLALGLNFLAKKIFIPKIPTAAAAEAHSAPGGGNSDQPGKGGDEEALTVPPQDKGKQMDDPSQNESEDRDKDKRDKSSDGVIKMLQGMKTSLLLMKSMAANERPETSSDDDNVKSRVEQEKSENNNLPQNKIEKTLVHSVAGENVGKNIKSQKRYSNRLRQQGPINDVAKSGLFVEDGDALEEEEEEEEEEATVDDEDPIIQQEYEDQTRAESNDLVGNKKEMVLEDSAAALKENDRHKKAKRPTKHESNRTTLNMTSVQNRMAKPLVNDLSNKPEREETILDGDGGGDATNIEEKISQITMDPSGLVNGLGLENWNAVKRLVVETSVLVREIMKMNKGKRRHINTSKATCGAAKLVQQGPDDVDVDIEEEFQNEMSASIGEDKVEENQNPQQEHNYNMEVEETSSGKFESTSEVNNEARLNVSSTLVSKNMKRRNRDPTRLAKSTEKKPMNSTSNVAKPAAESLKQDVAKDDDHGEEDQDFQQDHETVDDDVGEENYDFPHEPKQDEEQKMVKYDYNVESEQQQKEGDGSGERWPAKMTSTKRNVHKRNREQLEEKQSIFTKMMESGAQELDESEQDNESCLGENEEMESAIVRSLLKEKDAPKRPISKNLKAGKLDLSGSAKTQFHQAIAEIPTTSSILDTVVESGEFQEQQMKNDDDEEEHQNLLEKQKVDVGEEMGSVEEMTPISYDECKIPVTPSINAGKHDSNRAQVQKSKAKSPTTSSALNVVMAFEKEGMTIDDLMEQNQNLAQELEVGERKTDDNLLQYCNYNVDVEERSALKNEAKSSLLNVIPTSTSKTMKPGKRDPKSHSQHVGEETKPMSSITDVVEISCESLEQQVVKDDNPGEEDQNSWEEHEMANDEPRERNQEFPLEFKQDEKMVDDDDDDGEEEHDFVKEMVKDEYNVESEQQEAVDASEKIKSAEGITRNEEHKREIVRNIRTRKKIDLNRSAKGKVRDAMESGVFEQEVNTNQSSLPDYKNLTVLDASRAMMKAPLNYMSSLKGNDGLEGPVPKHTKAGKCDLSALDINQFQAAAKVPIESSITNVIESGELQEQQMMNDDDATKEEDQNLPQESTQEQKGDESQEMRSLEEMTPINYVSTLEENDDLKIPVVPTMNAGKRDSNQTKSQKFKAKRPTTSFGFNVSMVSGAFEKANFVTDDNQDFQQELEGEAKMEDNFQQEFKDVSGEAMGFLEEGTPLEQESLLFKGNRTKNTKGRNCSTNTQLEQEKANSSTFSNVVEMVTGDQSVEESQNYFDELKKEMMVGKHISLKHTKVDRPTMKSALNATKLKKQEMVSLIAGAVNESDEFVGQGMVNADDIMGSVVAPKKQHLSKTQLQAKPKRPTSSSTEIGGFKDRINQELPQDLGIKNDSHNVAAIAKEQESATTTVEEESAAAGAAEEEESAAAAAAAAAAEEEESAAAAEEEAASDEVSQSSYV